MGTSRNAILVVVCGLIGYSFQNAKMTPFKLIGDIPPGLPIVQSPPFSMEPDSDETFSQMISSMGSGLIVVPLIALMESIAICKAFSNGKSVDATQELIAIGTSNIANSFFQGFPITGSLSRGAVNNASGVRTPLGGLYTGKEFIKRYRIFRCLIICVYRITSYICPTLFYTILCIYSEINARSYHYCSSCIYGRSKSY